ncbi:hypothetical protein NTG1052_130010 [Candidatus Nitrotoga sp. 1052]|nr:hypothetical protein NTG1052_130010 [Candidatus Nitrotoga sp. 1052]
MVHFKNIQAGQSVVQLSLNNRKGTLSTYIGRSQRVKNAPVPRQAWVIVVFPMEASVVGTHKIKGVS